MKTSTRLITAHWLFLAVLALLVPNLAQAAPELSLSQDILAPRVDLGEQGYLLWQRLNEARANPRAVMIRLNIPEATVQAALGQDAWLLDAGLPPLAWNDQIKNVAGAHGRDMLDNVYYSQISKDGRTPAARLTASGYQPLFAEETLVALVFSNPVPLNAAVEVMVDNMLRDELSGTPGVVRNIFSPDFSEVGLALFSESVALLDGQPYVNLLVADFSQPVEERHFVVGQIDPETSLLLRSRAYGWWEEVVVLPGNLFQFELSGLGEDLFYWNTLAVDYVHTASTVDLLAGCNQGLDLRLLGLAP
ncbi:MAG: hypothetical protein HGA96_08120 [Desulfobulbaceae bacterium]|nr:hypothetical protein [Desulfobulbaceae bacterium]